MATISPGWCLAPTYSLLIAATAAHHMVSSEHLSFYLLIPLLQDTPPTSLPPCIGGMLLSAFPIGCLSLACRPSTQLLLQQLHHQHSPTSKKLLLAYIPFTIMGLGTPNRRISPLNNPGCPVTSSHFQRRRRPHLDGVMAPLDSETFIMAGLQARFNSVDAHFDTHTRKMDRMGDDLDFQAVILDGTKRRIPQIEADTTKMSKHLEKVEKLL
ncbi:hypothetical protein NDU88_007267 [Pleurodeles waltl]|uniref:Uncharacterized protein n=1 Tax=Pleurodeles waltl TaxID=8319 RepID=A0AAV7NUG4_PLEWA|nr:hypothetical protein NDU88_007267 [Pleurodeles waltl]